MKFLLLLLIFLIFIVIFAGCETGYVKKMALGFGLPLMRTMVNETMLLLVWIRVPLRC
ncbi:MAG: hypothetical protein UZ08_BCD001001131 [Candidatus Parvibacillus calidus]|nr:MAG: hypothetical protein UZ08_BCD001001131 [Candidatus Parvibacillus calidus]